MYINTFVERYYNLIIYIEKVYPVHNYTKFTDILQNPFFGTMAKYYDLDVYNLSEYTYIPGMLKKTGKNAHIATPYPSIHIFYNKE